MSDNIDREDREVLGQHGFDDPTGFPYATDHLPPPSGDFGSHPTEMYALFLQQATGQWGLSRFCYDRGNAEVAGETNRSGLPWRVVTYRAVADG